MKSLKFKHLSTLWANIIIECLKEKKIEKIYIAPGSRSTPLIQAINEKDFSITTFLDERSLAYSAVGYGKATGKAACIITTSGTAVANTLPAIIESYQSQTPLILITADRPPELIGVGANQAIDQISLFTNYVRAQKNIIPATEEIPADALTVETLKAIDMANEPIKGPIHINIMFREPFTEEENTLAKNKEFKRYQDETHSVKEINKILDRKKERIELNNKRIETIAKDIDKIEKGIILAGEIRSIQKKRCIIELAEKLKWAIIPDITSGIRQLENKNIANFAMYNLNKIEKPEVIILINGYFTSKEVNKWLKKTDVPIIQIKETKEKINPWEKNLIELIGDTEEITKKLKKHIRKKNKNIYTNKIIENNKQNKIDNKNKEEKVIEELSRKIKENEILFLSNSLPIRYFDKHATVHKNPPKTITNRGASGIDGIISTATGVAEGSKKRVIIIIGDTAAIHDLNALKRLKETKEEVICIIINNNGGRIFEKLEINNSKKVKKYFIMPTDQNFEYIGKAFNINYKKTNTGDIEIPKSTTLIEIIVN